jgi:hypothetical protein
MSKPAAVALHPPPPAPTMPQVQDGFYNMNMENEYIDQPFGNMMLNWDFNFNIDPAVTAARETPMDIEAWSSVFTFLGMINCSIGIR